MSTPPPVRVDTPIPPYSIRPSAPQSAASSSHSRGKRPAGQAFGPQYDTERKVERLTSPLYPTGLPSSSSLRPPQFSSKHAIAQTFPESSGSSAPPSPLRSAFSPGRSAFSPVPRTATWDTETCISVEESRNRTKLITLIVRFNPQTDPSLSLPHHQLTSLPDKLHLGGLQRVNFSGNQLSNFPPSLFENETITVLHFTANKITSLSPLVGKLTSLEQLLLAHNELPSLPDEVATLKTLVTLDVGCNQIEELPDMSALDSLRRLTANHNKITHIPLHLETLTQLTVLNLRKNALTEFDPRIGRLSALVELDLSGNQIAVVPKQVGALTQLETLNLGDNQIERLPSNFGDLTRLRTCLLSENLLKRLPQSMGELRSLQELALNVNQLSRLPRSLGGLETLTSIEVEDNPIDIDALPASIRGKIIVSTRSLSPSIVEED